MKKVELNEKESDIVFNALHLSNRMESTKSKVLLMNKIKKQMEKKPIKVASRKAKGRNLQKWAVEKIAELLEYEIPDSKDDSHIRSREMGQSGTDVVLSKKARQLFPFAVECKNQEKIDLPAFWEQAFSNGDINQSKFPILIVKNKKLKEPLIVMNWDVFSIMFAFRKLLPSYKEIGIL